MRISLVSLILLLALVMPVQASLEPRLAGNWKSEENPGTTLQIQSNGSYTKVSNGSVVDRGTLDALNRNFKFHSSSGNNDSGSFSVIGNKLILRGTMNPASHWVKSSSSKALIRTGGAATASKALVRKSPTTSKALVRKPAPSSSWNSSSSSPQRMGAVTKFGDSHGSSKYSSLTNNLKKNYSQTPAISNNNYVPPSNTTVPPNTSGIIPPSNNYATTPPVSNATPVNQPGSNSGGYNVASGANAYQKIASNRYAASSVSQAARAFGRGNIKSGIANLLSAARTVNTAGGSPGYVPPGGNLSPVNSIVQKVAPGVSNSFPVSGASDGHGTLSAYRKAADQKILNSLGAPSPIAIQPNADESGVYGVDSFETKAFTQPPKLIRIFVPGVFKGGPR